MDERLPGSWNAMVHGLTRAWNEADLPLSEYVRFRDALREELLARKMIGPNWSNYTHDQLVTIMSSVFPLGEREWARARESIELHLFRHQTNPPA
jgi:hypothetical protein